MRVHSMGIGWRRGVRTDAFRMAYSVSLNGRTLHAQPDGHRPQRVRVRLADAGVSADLKVRGRDSQDLLGRKR